MGGCFSHHQGRNLDSILWGLDKLAETNSDASLQERSRSEAAELKIYIQSDLTEGRLCCAGLEPAEPLGLPPLCHALLGCSFCSHAGPLWSHPAADSLKYFFVRYSFQTLGSQLNTQTQSSMHSAEYILKNTIKNCLKDTLERHSDITQKGYEKKRAKLLARYIPLIQGIDPSLQAEHRIPGPSQTTAVAPKQQKSRPTTSRDERFRSDVHTEAVQAALAKYKERKMPMPSKRRSVLVHSSVETYTPPELCQVYRCMLHTGLGGSSASGNSVLLTHPNIMPVIIILTTDTSSASEDEGSLRRPGRLTSTPLQSHSSIEPWLDRVIQGSSTSSSASSTSSHPGGRPTAAPSAAATPGATAATALAGLEAHTHIGQ
ncbi:Disco-interacting protein 2 A [Saguinus oedipus]|uniref:Disco-interacting protein 2 A n=1 Tax=Saguinus oedipus TaxID=9490 RepID=A0ABQ9TXY1_SAGOE|nr:Disco-interacting protein 2 A [Saguinus oedipus]